MAQCNKLAFKLLKSIGVRCTSSQTAQAVQVTQAAQNIQDVKKEQIKTDELEFFRTRESNPVKHTAEHLGKFYTIPRKYISHLIGKGSSPLSELKTEIETFTEWSILVRKPAIETIQYLSQTDYSKPVNKYIIYGEDGTGKTISLCHIVHYGFSTRKLIIYEPWAQRWFRFPAESASSLTNEGLVDLPIDAARFLLSFKNINYYVLPKLDLRLSKTYQFGINEIFEKGASISTIIDFGITRAKYACDVIAALFYEIKQASIAGKCNTLVAIDGFNAFYSKSTEVKDDFKQKIPASRISLTHSFLELTKSDWCNGQIVVTVDRLATKEKRESHLPRYLLDKEGFNHFDPFLPIAVENYTQDEFDTVIDYYKNRKWIREISPEGQKELRLICGSNPYKTMDYCKHL